MYKRCPDFLSYGAVHHEPPFACATGKEMPGLMFFQPGHPAEDRGFLFYYFFKSKYIVSAYLIIDTQCFQVPNGQFVDAVFVSGIYLLCGSKH